MISIALVHPMHVADFGPVAQGFLAGLHRLGFGNSGNGGCSFADIYRLLWR